MMKVGLILLLIIFSIQGFSQDANKIYLDEYGFPAELSEAKSYRTIMQRPHRPNKYLVNDYYLDDTMKQSSVYLDNKMYVQEGLFISYHSNGKKMEEGFYKDNSKVGNWTKWYSNGQIQEEYRFDNSKVYYQRLKTINFWDSLGTQLVINGKGEYLVEEEDPVSYSKGSLEGGLKNGIWIGYDEDGNIAFKEEYTQNHLIEGVSYDSKGKEFKYDKLNESVMMPFHKSVANNIRYPPTARRIGIQGSVFIRILFDIDGEILKARVIRGIGGGCDEEALRIVTMYKGKCCETVKRGQVHKFIKPQSMILPITFKLG